MSIWINFKQLLEERNVTQSELAKRTGLAQSYLSRLIKGHYKNIGQLNFEKIAKALYMTPDQLSRKLKGQTNIPKETPEDILERLRLANPVSVPVYTREVQKLC